MGKLCSKQSQIPSTVINPTPTSHISKITEDDFTLLKLIGKGSFGTVYLVRLKRNNSIYAMKILNKSILKEKNQEKNTKTERDLMIQLNSPFIVSIKFAFQSGTKLFLVQEFLQGGDLFFHIHSTPKFPNKKAKFYVIELILAIEFLHKNNMLYRDLKPENVLIGKDGHIKLTDFGISKILSEVDKTYTLCGTIQYLAPEIITGDGYNESVDWWSLGCIFYEMLTGRFPFKFSKNGIIKSDIYKKQIKFPEYIEDKAKDLILKFLEHDPNKRLGSGERGWENVKAHPYFEGVNWEDAFYKKLTPPFIPNVENDLDLKYFDNNFSDTNNEDYEELYDDGENKEEDYQGFTYVSNSLKELLNMNDEVSN